MNRKPYSITGILLLGCCLSFLSRSIQAAPTKIVTGPDNGFPSQVNTYSPGGITTGSFFAESTNFTGGIRVAMANVVGTNDIITGAGPGGGAHVSVYKGSLHTLIYSFYAFGPGFDLGIFVAGGDVDGDGSADIIVGPGDGTGSAPLLKVFSGRDGSTLLANFFAFVPGFSGGVRVAAGDINGDGRADIIAGAGPGGSQVIVFNGQDQTILTSFLPFTGFTGGLYVAAGDVNGDGLDDVIVGTGSGAARVAVFSGADGALLHNFFAFAGGTGGVRVAATDLNGDGRADIIASSGPGDSSRVRAFDGTTLESLADFIPYGSTTTGVFVGAIPRFPAQSLNISTRLDVLNGDNALISGFIITGNDSKNVLIRGIGPSTGLAGALVDPTLELFSGTTLLATNNDWRDTQEAAIEQTGIAPTNNLESAILENLPPGAYTAVMRGNAGGTGIGVVEAYDLNQADTDSQLANISTRGFVQSNDNVMIAGVILGGGTGSNQVLIRALGPSLSQVGISDPLSDPTLALYDSQGGLLQTNDDWRDTQEEEILATGIAPSNDLEAALISLVPPGNYTSIVAGLNGTIGVGLVEVYNLQ